jgi:hypothetical protein
MHITQLVLNNKRQVEDFLHLPFSIYRDIPHWVPPLQMDERLRLNPKRFPYYKHSQAEFFIACERSNPVEESTRAMSIFFFWRLSTSVAKTGLSQIR